MKREKLIRKRGMRTQSEIAKALGITTQYYSMIELGERTPSYPLMVKIAEYFDVKPDYFFLQ